MVHWIRISGYGKLILVNVSTHSKVMHFTCYMYLVLTLLCNVDFVGHQSLTSGMELKNNILVSGNADSTVKVNLNLLYSIYVYISGPVRH